MGMQTVELKIKQLTNQKAQRESAFLNKFKLRADMALKARKWVDANPDKLQRTVWGPVALEVQLPYSVLSSCYPVDRNPSVKTNEVVRRTTVGVAHLPFIFWAAGLQINRHYLMELNVAVWSRDELSYLSVLIFFMLHPQFGDFIRLI